MSNVLDGLDKDKTVAAVADHSQVARIESRTAEAIKDVVCGSVAGAIGKFIEYPFDTVKVRLQAQSIYAPVYAGPIDCFRQSVRSDGIVKGLYRGISAPLAGAAIENSSLFLSYRMAQEFILRTCYEDEEKARHADKSHHYTAADRQRLPLAALVCSGAMSGAFTSLILTPIELIKCQMQVTVDHAHASTHAHTRYRARPGILTIITTVFRRHGLLGFWRGQLGTLIRETGGSAAWFGSYEAISAGWKVYNSTGRDDCFTQTNDSTGAMPQSTASLPIHQQLLAGAAAGIAYNFVCFPADTIKSRMQTEHMHENPNDSIIRNNEPSRSALSDAAAAKPNRVKSPPVGTFWSTGHSIWHQQGLKGLYRGCGITVLRAAPSSAFIFFIYEALRSWMT